MEQHTYPTLRVPTQVTPRVPLVRPPSPTATASFPSMPQWSPRCHPPPQVTQEEPTIESAHAVTDVIMAQQLEYHYLLKRPAHAVTDVIMAQQLEYHYLLKRPDLKPIWKKTFTNELGHLTQGIPM
jgi:hypothetical protein